MEQATYGQEPYEYKKFMNNDRFEPIKKDFYVVSKQIFIVNIVFLGTIMRHRKV